MNEELEIIYLDIISFKCASMDFPSGIATISSENLIDLLFFEIWERINFIWFCLLSDYLVYFQMSVS